MILLVNPPTAKPCEPPAGLAQLAGALCANNISYKLLDANLEGILYLLRGSEGTGDTWTRRARKHISTNLASLRNIVLYRNFDSYKRAVSDVNRLLAQSSAHRGVRISLEDYEDRALSPVKMEDLFRAAQHPEENPFYPYFSRRLHEAIEESGPSFIGFSLNYLSQALCTFAMAGFVKKCFPGIQVILGGGLITSWMKNPTWKDSFGGLIDHLISGPGESPLLSLLGKTVVNKTPLKPAYNFDHADQYMAPGFILPYSTSSGCYWAQCTFCPERAEGNRYVQRPPDSVITDLCYLADEYKPALIHFTDNAISPAVLRTLTEYPIGAPWYGFVRVTDHLTDPEFCAALQRSGCVMLKLGVESGDQRVLDDMQKGNQVSTTSRALKALSGAGIATYIYLLFGTPQESEAEARITLDFARKHSPYIDFMNTAIFNLPLFSPDSKALATADFYEGDLSLYTDFIHPKGWDRRSVRRFLEGTFKKDPAIKPILQRQPPYFTSNHAPFFSKGFMTHIGR